MSDLLRAEIDRLTERLAEVTVLLAELMSENERMREALGEISRYPTLAPAWQEIAKAALSAREGEG